MISKMRRALSVNMKISPAALERKTTSAMVGKPKRDAAILGSRTATAAGDGGWVLRAGALVRVDILGNGRTRGITDNSRK
jgi:hypothetical protein